MSYVGKIGLKLKVRKLRESGQSIKSIEKKLKVSRSSISRWVRDVKLTDQQLKKLYQNKKTGQLRGCIVAAKNKVKKREKLTKQLIIEGKKEMGHLSERDRFIAGVAMYFAEGEKSTEHVGFSNSDPKAIKFITKWFRDFCKVPEDKFRCSLYIHDNLNEVEAKAFWSKITKIPLAQFRKSYIVKNNPKRLRKSKHPHGILRVDFCDVNLHRKIMGWISGILG